MKKNRKQVPSLLEQMVENRIKGEQNELPLCEWCKEEILAEELVLPKSAEFQFHRDCLIRIVAGSIGHQNKSCSCYGGIEEDPPGLTARQAATAAATKFRATLDKSFLI